MKERNWADIDLDGREINIESVESKRKLIVKIVQKKEIVKGKKKKSEFFVKHIGETSRTPYKGGK